MTSLVHAGSIGGLALGGKGFLPWFLKADALAGSPEMPMREVAFAARPSSDSTGSLPVRPSWALRRGRIETTADRSSKRVASNSGRLRRVREVIGASAIVVRHSRPAATDCRRKPV